MAELDFNQLMSHFDKRTLPDGRIGPTDLAGWRRVLELFRQSDWRIEDAPRATADLVALFAPAAERPTIKVFVGHQPVQVNVFLIESTSIDFDFAAAEMIDQDAVGSLTELVRLCSRAAQASCELSPEGFGTAVVARYEPVLDEFSLLGRG